MKNLLFLCLLFSGIYASNAQHCLSHINLNQRLENNPELAYKSDRIEKELQDWINANADRLQTRVVITIPVIVHVVWNQSEENISAEQIQSQIDVLNQDFRMINNDLSIVPTVFNSRIADLEIEFCLVSITRTQTSIPSIGFLQTGGRRAICYTELGGRDAWDTKKYLNIWIGKSDGALGEASFPGMDVAAEDGVRIDPRYFGTTGIVAAPYNLGRTTTHEIGHYFNLKHLWGTGLDNFDCTGDDDVTDTPLQGESFRGKCPSTTQSTCGELTGDMTMNFMNYTDDACLAMFTTGQKARVWASINTFRAEFLEPPNCAPVSVSIDPLLTKEIKLLQNPVRTELVLEINTSGKKDFVLKIISRNGNVLLQKALNRQGVHNIPIGNLPNGLYLINVWHKKKFTTKKLIIAK